MIVSVFSSSNFWLGVLFSEKTPRKGGGALWRSEVIEVILKVGIVFYLFLLGFLVVPAVPRDFVSFHFFGDSGFSFFVLFGSFLKYRMMEDTPLLKYPETRSPPRIRRMIPRKNLLSCRIPRARSTTPMMVVIFSSMEDFPRRPSTSFMVSFTSSAALVTSLDTLSTPFSKSVVISMLIEIKCYFVYRYIFSLCKR